MSLHSGLEQGLSQGIMFGVFMALLLGTLHIYRVKSIDPDASFDVHQTQVISVEMPYDAVFELCRSAVQSIERCTILGANLRFGSITAKIGMSWWSFGEEILVEVRRGEADSKTWVSVSSKPALPTTVADYGRNLQNVRHVIHELRRAAAV
ncbi:MAG: hypothetical protein JXB47_06270 [Anaerolineae bacterium]|nr:hypothetical protein [Anaerolineae bacterium]